MDEPNESNFDGQWNGSVSGPVEPDEIDILLDRALTSYTRGEPRSGLVARVLASARTARQRRPRAWRAWAIAVPGWIVAVAAVVILFRVRPIEIVIGHHSSNSEIAQSVPPGLQPTLSPATIPTAPPSPSPVRTTVRVHAHRPDQITKVQPITLDSIVMAPIRLGAIH